MAASPEICWCIQHPKLARPCYFLAAFFFVVFLAAFLAAFFFVAMLSLTSFPRSSSTA